MHSNPSAPRNAAALLMIVGLAVAGCSAPLRPGLARYQENREIEKLANNSSFPLAAEVGLASSDVSNKKDDAR